MFFMRLPSVPMASTTAENRETKPSIKGPVEKSVDLKALPEGFMGKLLVYKSGAVKMRLGEVLYDVSDFSYPFVLLLLAFILLPYILQFLLG